MFGLVHCAVGAGGCAGFETDEFIELGEVGDSDLFGDDFDGPVCGAEESAGFLCSSGSDEFLDGHAVFFAEHAKQLSRGDVGVFGDFGDSEGFGEVA